MAQAFQKAVLQWNPAKSTTEFVNVLDMLHDMGKDGSCRQRVRSHQRLTRALIAAKAAPGSGRITLPDQRQPGTKVV